MRFRPIESTTVFDIAEEKRAKWSEDHQIKLSVIVLIGIDRICGTRGLRSGLELSERVGNGNKSNVFGDAILFFDLRFE